MNNSETLSYIQDAYDKIDEARDLIRLVITQDSDANRIYVTLENELEELFGKLFEKYEN